MYWSLEHNDHFLIVSFGGECQLPGTFFSEWKNIVPSQSYWIFKSQKYVQLHCVGDGKISSYAFEGFASAKVWCKFMYISDGVIEQPSAMLLMSQPLHCINSFIYNTSPLAIRTHTDLLAGSGPVCQILIRSSTKTSYTAYNLKISLHFYSNKLL